MPRERGTFHIRESSNPFMVTTSQNMNMLLSNKFYQQQEEMNKTHSNRSLQQQQQQQKEFDLSFLYSRESDRIGQGIQNSDSCLAKVLAQKESLSEIAKRKQLPSASKSVSAHSSNISSKMPSQGEIERELESYAHTSKDEDPLFSTSSNQYGAKKPSVATYNSVRISRNQTFSKSFHGMMPRDQGLNTSMTHSHVHAQLDPQFV